MSMVTLMGIYLSSLAEILKAYPEDYWENARLSKVQDPAQAWNAITVGSYTKLYSIDGIANAQILCKNLILVQPQLVLSIGIGTKGP